MAGMLEAIEAVLGEATSPEDFEERTKGLTEELRLGMLLVELVGRLVPKVAGGNGHARRRVAGERKRALPERKAPAARRNRSDERKAAPKAERPALPPPAEKTPPPGGGDEKKALQLIGKGWSLRAIAEETDVPKPRLEFLLRQAKLAGTAATECRCGNDTYPHRGTCKADIWTVGDD